MPSWATGLTLTVYPTLTGTNAPLQTVDLGDTTPPTIALADYYNDGLDDPNSNVLLTNANLISTYGFPPGSTYNVATQTITLGVTTIGNYFGFIRVENGPITVDVQVPVTVQDNVDPVLTNAGTTDATVLNTGGSVVSAATFTDASTITYSGESNGGGALPAGITYSPATRTFTVANGTANGVYNVQETATDASGNSTSDTFVITVTDPTVNFLIDSISVDDDILALEGTVPFVVSGTNGLTATGNTAVLTGEFGSAALTVTRVDQFNGTFELPASHLSTVGFIGDTYTLSVTNGLSEVATNTATLSVNPVHSPGLLTVTDNSNDGVWDTTLTNTAIVPGDEVYVIDENGTGFDTGGSDWAAGDPAFTFAQLPALFKWWGKRAPNDAIFNSSNTVDNGVLIGVSLNQPPVIDNPRGNESVAEDTIFTYVFPANYASDPDGDALTLTLTDGTGAALPSWITFDGTDTMTVSPLQGDVTTVTVRARVTDPEGLFDEELFTVTPIPVDDAPVVSNVISTQTVVPDVVTVFPVPASTITDEEGATLTYSAVLFPSGAALPAWIVFDPLVPEFTFSPTSAEEGSYQIQLSASDGTSITSTVFNLNVSNGTTVIKLRARNESMVPVQKNVGWHIFTDENTAAAPVSSGFGVTDSNGEIEIPYGISTGTEVYVWFFAADNSWRDTVKCITQLAS